MQWSSQSLRFLCPLFLFSTLRYCNNAAGYRWYHAGRRQVLPRSGGVVVVGGAVVRRTAKSPDRDINMSINSKGSGNRSTGIEGG